MNKCFVVILIILGLTSCAAKNKHYYQSHPKELQQAVKACPEKQPKGLTCNQLEELAIQMNRLAYQLQFAPQGFGKKIIALQETIAREEEQIKKETNNLDLKSSLAQNRLELADHLAVVKWFESPSS